MNRERQSKVKPKKCVMPVFCTEDFRAAVQEQARKEDRDVSKLVRRLLREKYPALPED